MGVSRKVKACQHLTATIPSFFCSFTKKILSWMESQWTWLACPIQRVDHQGGQIKIWSLYFEGHHFMSIIFRFKTAAFRTNSPVFQVLAMCPKGSVSPQKSQFYALFSSLISLLVLSKVLFFSIWAWKLMEFAPKDAVLKPKIDEKMVASLIAGGGGATYAK